MKQETRKCQKCKKDFVIEPDDFSFYEKMKVPAPTFCPDCRFKLCAVFRNEKTLYKRTCALCNYPIVSMYHPNSPYVVYCNDCWVSDKWDPYSYALEYDVSKSFFEQLKELIIKVPKSATASGSTSGPNINSEYVNFSGSNKNCYLIFNSTKNENCAYSRGINDSRDAFDIYYGDRVESSYECVNIHRSTRVVYGKNISDCVDSRFVLNCSGCQNCFGCVNLRHKSYYFFNEPLEREEWEERVNQISGSYKKTEEIKNKFSELSLKFPYRSNNNLKVQNCFGDYIFESKNCSECFEVSFSEDVLNSFSVKCAKDCADMIGFCRNSELLYNGTGVGAGARRVLCSWWVESSQDIEYSFATRQSNNCFGCDAVKNGAFVILNKKYSKEEYQKLKNHIIKELKDNNLYGNFFPPELSFFAYNESIAQDNFPLTKKEALEQGFRWEDNIQKTEGKETLQPEEIPDHIKDVPDSITEEILRCVYCNRNYKIIMPELLFYRNMNIPIPRKCFYCRHQDRIIRRGPYKFWNRNCAKCRKDIITNYSPDRPEIVYCEKCYQQEVY